VILGETYAFPSETTKSEAYEIYRLKRNDYSRPRQILKSLNKPKKKNSVSNILNWKDDKSEILKNQIELYIFKGIGSYYGMMLENIGITCVGDLSKWEPDDLYNTLQNDSVNFLFHDPPRLDMVTVWVLSARGRK